MSLCVILICTYICTFVYVCGSCYKWKSLIIYVESGLTLGVICNGSHSTSTGKPDSITRVFHTPWLHLISRRRKCLGEQTVLFWESLGSKNRKEWREDVQVSMAYLQFFKCGSICTGVPFRRAPITTMIVSHLYHDMRTTQMATMKLSNHNALNQNYKL